MGTAAIVCVDDDTWILSSLGEQLQRQFGPDYDIELAADGEEGLAAIAELQAEGITIPLILSDQAMPGMSGDRFLIHAHQLVPQALKILLTGENRAEAVGNALNQASLYRYIAKPWDETDLLLTVQEALRSYEQRQQLQAQQQYLAQMNQQLAQSLATLQATLDATADGILVLDQAGNITNFNQKSLDLLGIEREAKPTTDVAGGSDRLPQLPQIQREVQQRTALWELLSSSQCLPIYHELTARTPSGERCFECCGQSQVVAGKITGQVWSFRDITLRKQAEALIQHQAHHDGLTGLANRVQFDRHLAAKLSEAERSQECFAVLFVDLDHFKQVNDTLGHSVGDALLRQVVDRLQSCSRHQDLIARWGGDEFTLILSDLLQAEDSVALAQRIWEALQFPFEIDGHCLQVTASIGIAFYPEDGVSANDLLNHADRALYQAKYQGRNGYARFTAVEKSVLLSDPPQQGTPQPPENGWAAVA